MDLDAVEAGDSHRSACRRPEGCDRVGDLLFRHGTRKPVAALAVVEVELPTLGLDGGGGDRVASEAVALADASGVHDLCDGKGAVALDAPDHRLPGPCLSLVAHPRLEEVSLRIGCVGIKPLGDD